jgi:hypothetical protein
MIVANREIRAIRFRLRWLGSLVGEKIVEGLRIQAAFDDLIVKGVEKTVLPANGNQDADLVWLQGLLEQSGTTHEGEVLGAQHDLQRICRRHLAAQA